MLTEHEQMADNEANGSRVDQSIKLQREMSHKILYLFEDYICKGMTFAEVIGVMHLTIYSLQKAKLDQ